MIKNLELPNYMNERPRYYNKITLDYIFILFFVFSFLTLPFFHITFLGFFIPLFVFIFLMYLYLKILLFTQKRYITFQKESLVSLLLFLLLFCSFLSITFSYYKNWRDFFEIFFYIFFVFALLKTVKLSLMQMKTTLKLIWLNTTILGIYGIYNFLSGKSPWFQFSLAEQIGLSSRNVDIYTVLIGLPIAINYYIFRKSKLALISVLIMGFAVLTSFSRGAVFTTIFMILFSTSISNIFGLKLKITFRNLLLISVVLITIIFIYFNNQSYITAHLLERFMLITESHRIPLVSESFKFMFSHPFTGIGLGNYKYFTNNYVLRSVNGVLQWLPIGTAHNSYLNFGAETGIFGFIFITILITYPFFLYLKIYFKERKFFMYSREYQFLYVVGISLAFFLIIINFFNVFYIDSAYLFWFFYFISIEGLLIIKKELYQQSKMIKGNQISGF